ncbi:bzip transcription factor tga10 [Quercus suber]|uniref:Bzip transcription factor tga10 n=1 Tax=Quercus suber TaxID=58331 RepID=A0AAW0JH54_QUESU|nr:bZIP transcription factor TGA10-like [Quercus suber]
MGFSGTREVEEEEQKTKLLRAPFMASNIKSTNHPTQVEQQQQQQQHHHHQQQQQHHQHQHQHQHQQQHQLQLQDHYHHEFSYGMMQSSSSSSIPGNYTNKDTVAYDLGELDQALFLYLDGQDPSTVQDQRQSQGMRPPTLNIFPSQPMHVEPSSTKASTGLVSPSNSGSKRPSEPFMELANARNDVPTGPEPAKAIKCEGNRKGPTSSSEQEGPKTPDPKTLRRLAQNREAARKSRLRKKAYVQQLESSRIKLTQLEQELQRAKAQGMFFGGGALIGGDQGHPLAVNNVSSDAAFFDMEYARWLEEHHRITCELRAAVQEHLPENELRLFVDNFLAHFDEKLNLKSMVAKADVFHLVSGMWKTPAERCFMWMGGFRPSELIKVPQTYFQSYTNNNFAKNFILQFDILVFLLETIRV